MKTTQFDQRMAICSLAGITAAMMLSCSQIADMPAETDHTTQAATASPAASSTPPPLCNNGDPSRKTTGAGAAPKITPPDTAFRAKASDKGRLKAEIGPGSDIGAKEVDADTLQKQARYLTELERIRAKHPGDAAGLEKERASIKASIFGLPADSQ